MTWQNFVGVNAQQRGHLEIVHKVQETSSDTDIDIEVHIMYVH